MYDNPDRLAINLEDKYSRQFYNIVRIAFNQSLQFSYSNLSISEGCYQSIKTAIDDKDFRFMTKLSKDSAKNKNDLGSYDDCISLDYRDNILKDDVYNRTSILSELTYIIIEVEDTSPSDNKLVYNFHEGFVFGVCIRKGCNESEYRMLMLDLNNLSGNPLNVSDVNSTVTVIDVSESKKKRFSEGFILGLIPFYILVLLLIVSCQPKIFIWMFKVCFFKRKRSDYVPLLEDKSNKSALPTDNSIQMNSFADIDGDKRTQFINCFKRSANFEELFTVKTQTNNDSGLSFVKGLRALSLIYLLLGFVYMLILGSPLKIYCPIQHKELMTSYMFFIVVVATKISPRLLFTVSGFTLCYKFICFLEDKAEHQRDILTGSFKRSPTISQKNLSTVEITKIVSNEFSINYHKRVITFSMMLNFISRQFYKVLAYIFAVFFFYYSFYHISTITNDPEPMWVYFGNKIIDQANTFEVFKQLFMISCFFFKHQDMNVFWMVQNEFYFYIISTFVIFVFYKNQLRLDVFFVGSIICLFVLKIIIFFRILSSFDNFLVISGTDFFRIIFTNPLNNYIYYLIGCYFGLVNYLIQKSISVETIYDHNKRFLIIPYRLLQFFKHKSLMKLGILSVITLCLFVFDSLCYSLLPNYIIETNNDSVWRVLLNVFFMIDAELIITLFMLLLIGFIITGENIIIPFLSHKNWLFFSRPYFSNILLIYFTLYYTLYHTESRIKLVMFNIVFYSLFSFCVHIISTTLCYVFLEVPYKRLTKLLFQYQAYGAEENIKEKK